MLTAFFFKKENIILELDRLDLKKGERERLLGLVDELVEYKLVNLVLEKLESRDKELFLEQLNAGSAEIFIEFLRGKIQDAEEILVEYSKNLESEILADIRELGAGKNG
jgi:hypothetical protein